MSVGGVAEALGKGLVAGAVGTAAMTVSSTLEAKLTEREASTVPAEAVETALDIEPQSEGDEQRLNNLAHWGYGTGWGAVRGLLGAAGMSGLPAMGVHLVAVWGAAQGLLPALGVAKPTWEYGAKALGTDVWHHAVYAVATGLAYDWLDNH